MSLVSDLLTDTRNAGCQPYFFVTTEDSNDLRSSDYLSPPPPCCVWPAYVLLITLALSPCLALPPICSVALLPTIVHRPHLGLLRLCALLPALHPDACPGCPRCARRSLCSLHWFLRGCDLSWGSLTHTVSRSERGVGRRQRTADTEAKGTHDFIS